MTPAASRLTPLWPAPTTNPGDAYLGSLPAASSRRGRSRLLKRVSLLLCPPLVSAAAIGLPVWPRVPWAAIRPEHCHELRAALIDSGAPAATRNALQDTLRGVLRQARLAGALDRDTEEACRDVLRNWPEDDLPVGRHLSADDLAAMFRAASGTGNRALRDRAALALLVHGLRRAEVASLTLADLDLGDRLVRVHGKGARVRVLPVFADLLPHLEAWRTARGAEQGPLITRVRRGGRLTLEPVKGEAVERVVGRLAARAGLGKVLPHDLRRSAAEILRSASDLEATSMYLGHSDQRTTIRYLNRGARAARLRVVADRIRIFQPVLEPAS